MTVLNKYKNLLLNTGLFAFSQFATKLITFFLVPLYTYYMTTEQFGVTDMSSTVVALLLPLATLSASDAVLRFAIDDRQHQDRYISLGVGLIILSVIVVAALLPLLDLPFFGGLGDYKLLFLLCYVVSAAQYFFGLLARALNELKLIPVASIVSTLVTGGLAVLLIAKMGYATEGFFWSLIIGNLCGALTFILLGRQFKHVRLIFHKADVELLKKMLAYSIPMIPNALFWWIGVSINRFFITGMIGIGASGLFAAAQKIPNLLNTFSGIFQQAWQLSAFQEFKKKDISGFFATVFKLYHSGIAVVSTVIIVLAQWFASFMLQKDFYYAWPMISIMILAFYFNILNAYYGTVYTSAMKTKHLMTTTVAGAVSSVLCTWLLIPVAGIYGAGIAMVISNALVLVLRVITAKKILAFKVDWPVVILTMALLIAQSVVSVIHWDSYLVVSAVFTVVICGLQVFACRSVFGKVKSMLAKRK